MKSRYISEVWDSLARVPQPRRLEAVEYAARLEGRGLPVIFDQQHLAMVAGVRSQSIGLIRRAPSNYYNVFRIAKRTGGSRLVTAPGPELRALQDWLHLHVTRHFDIHPACHGFVPGRSIITNAVPHVGSKEILKLDVRDFFGSVKHGDVFLAFRRLGYSRAVARLFTRFTTLDDSLPQGAPTSPTIANHIAFGLDLRLDAFARRHDLAYTRYADDLTFSGAVGQSRIRRTIEVIMRDTGFRPNDKKLRFVSDSSRQTVTGLVVNDKLNWPRDRRRWLRQQIHYLGQFGVDGHLRHANSSRSGFKEFIYGHVYALKAVRPDEAAGYLRILDRLDWDY